MIYAQVIFFYPVLPIYHIFLLYTIVSSGFECVIINLFIQGKGGALDLYLIQGFILNAIKVTRKEEEKRKGRGS